MKGTFVPFDAVRTRIAETLDAGEPIPEAAGRVYLVRNLYGQVRVSVSDAVENDAACRDVLQRLADRLRVVLGAHGPPAERGVLFVNPSLLTNLDSMVRELRPGVYLADRLVTGGDWWTVRGPEADPGVRRCTLFSVKGGVGRSTTAAVLAWHLARTGERVLVVDLDLESPGLSSAMLSASARPEFGVTDWFVEDLVGQGNHVIGKMTAAPAWARDLEGEVRVVPAHGLDPGEYLAKLGRVYMDTGEESWTARLARMLSRLETESQSTIVLLESRSGLHDIAASTVTDLNAEVLLFAVDSESHWTDYDVLFQHWQTHGLATHIRDRLSIVSALTPDLNTEGYLLGFRERSWDLFRTLYDEVVPASDSEESFSFDVQDEDAPHHPIPIHWTRGLAAGASLRDIERTPVSQAYTQFLHRFDNLIAGGNGKGET